MNDMDEYRKLYKEYLEEFEHQQRLNIISEKAKPLTFNEFLPESITL